MQIDRGAKMNNLQHLKWDSDFFGFKVAKLEGDMSVLDVERCLQSSDAKLVYLASNSIDIAQYYKQCHVDNKTTYFVHLNDKFYILLENDLYLEEYCGNTNDELRSLAIQASLFSRFVIDKKMPSGCGNRLYEQWIENSIDKKFADATLVAKYNNKIVGMVTVGRKGSRGDIGLVAVDESVRGKSIGTKLIKYAQNWFFDREIYDVQVVTQGINIPACRLYEKCGFKKESVISYYHLWFDS
jgi:dTDP-4-amino-4,6-dideoxy-D-galactose acyltransferase